MSFQLIFSRGGAYKKYSILTRKIFSTINSINNKARLNIRIVWIGITYYRESSR